MGYTAEQLDRWAAWLETETDYGLAKFPADAQLDYFAQGVARGDFSWKMSAVGYLNRAILRVHDGQPLEGMELRTVQELGKAAHNHITCALVGRLAWDGTLDFRPAFSDVVGEWRAALATERMTQLELTRTTVTTQNERFDRLQAIQDADNPAEFDAYALEMGLPIQAAFLDLAERHGWPQPGVSSTEDVRLWTPVSTLDQ